MSEAFDQTMRCSLVKLRFTSWRPASPRRMARGLLVKREHLGRQVRMVYVPAEGAGLLIEDELVMPPTLPPTTGRSLAVASRGASPKLS